jgi:ribosomal protein L37AE/L43A
MAGLSSELKRKMQFIIRSKGCKRCGGDLSVECDIYGVYIECIQCGATFNKSEYIPTNGVNIEETGSGKTNETVDGYLNTEIPRPKVLKER